MIDESFINSLPTSVKELRYTAWRFISMARRMIGHKVIAIDEDEDGIRLFYTQKVLLSSVNRPKCVTIKLLLWVPRKNYGYADISPVQSYSLVADPTYVFGICAINRRMMSKDAYLTSGWTDAGEEGAPNLKRVTIYYSYDGLYNLSNIVTNPNKLARHLKYANKDLAVLYSMLHNQFSAREDDLIGGTLIDASTGFEECPSCRSCPGWRY